MKFLLPLLLAVNLALATPAQDAEVVLQACLSLEGYMDPFNDCLWPVLTEEVVFFIEKGAKVELTALEKCSRKCMEDYGPSIQKRLTVLRVCITECFHQTVTTK